MFKWGQGKFSSTNCYFVAEDRNADHRQETTVGSMQTSSPPPHLPTSCSLPTIFFVEQGLVASMLTKHLPLSLPPRGHQTALQEPHSILLPHTRTSFHSVLSGKGNPVIFGILLLWCYEGYIGAPITHRTTMNKRREIALMQFAGRKDNMQRERILGVSV